MPLKKSRRLPKRYSRPVSKDTKRFVRKHMQRKKHSKEKLKRFMRKAQVSVGDIRTKIIRWLVVGIILIGVLGFGFLMFSPAIQVRKINVTRLSPRLDIEHVQKSLSPMFGKHLFFLSSFEVNELLQEHIPDIHEVKIGKSYPDVLHVRIALDPLVARLRIADPDGSDLSAGTGTTVDFLTDQGVYVTTTAAQDISVLPLITLIDWGVRPQPGALLIEPRFLERMNAAELTLLRQFGKEVFRRTVFIRAQEFHFLIGETELWFDLRSPLDEQIERYRVFLANVGTEEVPEYIDLRIADRVIYR